MKKLRIFAYTILTISLILCSATDVFAKRKFGKITNEDRAAGAPADYPEAGAIVLFDMGKLRIGSETITLEIHQRIKILTEAGVNELPEFSIDYYPKYEKIKSFKAHTVTPDGKKHKVEKNAIFVKEVGRKKERTFTFPQVQPGAILELTYKLISSDFYSLKPWFFQGSIYTMHSEFSVYLPKEFQYSVNTRNIRGAAQKPERSEESTGSLTSSGRIDKLAVFKWTLKDLPPIKDEPYMSSVNDYLSALRFKIIEYSTPSYYKNFQKPWNEEGEQFGTMVLDDDYRNTKKEVRALVEQVTAGLTTPKEKSKAIYDYIVTNIETSFDYNHWGLFHNERMDKLLESNIGSGEEKNVLLVDMHAAVGIKAYPVLISTRNVGLFNPGSVNWLQFNYLIVYVQFDNSYEFLDASARYNAYGVLPPTRLVRAGLLIDAKNSEIVRIVSRELVNSRTDITLVTIPSDGPAVCSTTCKFTGYYAASYARRFERKSPEEFAKENFLDRLDYQYEMGEYNIELSDAGELVMTTDYTLEDYTERLDNNVIAKALTFAYRSNPFESDKRFFPVDFQYPLTYTCKTIISFEDSTTSFVLPEEISVVFSGATFSKSFEATPEGIGITSKLEIITPIFGKHKYAGLKEFFDLVAQAETAEITAILAE